ncbi:MAG: hypothetical protein WKF82_08425 [Nocardioidaceae bacterium]
MAWQLSRTQDLVRTPLRQQIDCGTNDKRSIGHDIGAQTATMDETANHSRLSEPFQVCTRLAVAPLTAQSRDVV